jgi:hypothetical protein
VNGEPDSPPNQAETSCCADEENVMRGSLTPTLGAIGAGVCLTTLTPTLSPDVAPDDVYAWRWTVDTILDAQKKASRWNGDPPDDGGTTLTSRRGPSPTPPNETRRSSLSAAHSIPGSAPVAPLPRRSPP